MAYVPPFTDEDAAKKVPPVTFPTVPSLHSAMALGPPEDEVCEMRATI